MKIWFEVYNRYKGYDDGNVRFGIGWFRHHRDHPWWGLTITFYIPIWTLLELNFVSDWEAYNKRINRRKR